MAKQAKPQAAPKVTCTVTLNREQVEALEVYADVLGLTVDALASMAVEDLLRGDAPLLNAKGGR